MKKIVGILLAAGGSSRFGNNKLIQPLPEGDPMVVTSVRNLLAVLPEVVAVVRPSDCEVRDALSIVGVRLVENACADEGMSTSVAAGIRSAPDADGWIIALADMPWVQPATIAALVRRLGQDASIVVPEYRGRRGNPAGFSSPWKDALCNLSGDQGARVLIKSNKGQVERVAVEDAGILRDVDVPADL